MNAQDLFSQSELAFAAYATPNNSALSAQKTSLKNAGLSDVQADTLASRYAVVTQYNDTAAEGGQGTSFSATVFKDVGCAHRMRGASLVKLLLLIFAALVLLITATFVFFEGRKAYWDHQVREMCERDGGSTTYEKVNISRAQFQAWGGVGDVLGLPSESDNRKDIPFFRRSRDEALRTGNPQLMRLETDFVRRSDEKLLGKSVHYFRRGGDFPSWAHESSFGCPVPTLPIEKTIFIIEDKIK
jgi:hypothetical protein